MAKADRTTSMEPFKHPSKKLVVVAHSLQIFLALVSLGLSGAFVSAGYYDSRWYVYVPDPYFVTSSVFASASIAIYAALAIILLCSQCKPIWLFLIIFNVLIMTLGIATILTTLFSVFEGSLGWGELAAVSICILLSIPSLIRASKLRRHAKRAEKLTADEAQDDIRRKSIELEDGLQSDARSVRIHQSIDENRKCNAQSNTSRPISTAETTAHWSNGTGSATLDHSSDRASETLSLPSYNSRLSKDMSDEIRQIL